MKMIKFYWIWFNKNSSVGKDAMIKIDLELNWLN